MLAPGGTLVVQTLNQDSLQRKLLAPLARGKNFDRLFRCAELHDAFAGLGLRDVEFLHAYYPLSLTTRSRRPGLATRAFSTSFAVRGRRPT
jgi:hypothetical protein